MSPETTLLAEPGLLVTTLRLIVDDQTIPVRDITNISTFTETPDQARATATVFIGLLINLLGVVPIKLGVQGLLLAGAYLVAVAGTVTFLYGLYRARNRTILYGVAVVTPTSRVRAITTLDLGRMQRVLGALNHAVASR